MVLAIVTLTPATTQGHLLQPGAALSPSSPQPRALSTLIVHFAEKETEAHRHYDWPGWAMEEPGRSPEPEPSCHPVPGRAVCAKAAVGQQNEDQPRARDALQLSGTHTPGPEREGTRSQSSWGSARLEPSCGPDPQNWGFLGRTALWPPKKDPSTGHSLSPTLPSPLWPEGDPWWPPEVCAAAH